jgi:hypothetical protein
LCHAEPQRSISHLGTRDASLRLSMTAGTLSIDEYSADGVALVLIQRGILCDRRDQLRMAFVLIQRGIL